MYKYKQNNDLAYATSLQRTVTVKKGTTIYEGERRLMSAVRTWEEERRCMKTKETKPKWLKSPNICTFNAINYYEHWVKVTEDEGKWKENWVC